MAPNIAGFDNLFKSEVLFNNDEFDPDQNFFNDQNMVKSESLYYKVEDVANHTHTSENISVVHVNIRSLRKNLDSFKEFIEESNNAFNIICVSETWCSNDEIATNSSLHLKNFKTIPFERKAKKRGGGVLIYVNKNINHKIRSDLSISNCDIEILTIELLNPHSKNILISCVHKPPNGDSKVLSTFLANCISITNFEKKSTSQ